MLISPNSNENFYMKYYKSVLQSMREKIVSLDAEKDQAFEAFKSVDRAKFDQVYSQITCNGTAPYDANLADQLLDDIRDKNESNYSLLCRDIENKKSILANGIVSYQHMLNIEEALKLI